MQCTRVAILVVAIPQICLISSSRAQIPKGYFTNVTNISSSGLDERSLEHSPAISSDGLQLFFSDAPSDGNGQWDDRIGLGEEDIWMSTRETTDGAFGPAVNLSTINSAHNDSSATISADGLTIYFGSDRSGVWNIYRATRNSQNEPFHDATALGSSINTEDTENAPSITSDGLTLFFHRAPDGDVWEEYIWFARRQSIDDEFGTATPFLQSDNHPQHFPSVSGDGSVVFFSDWFSWLGLAPREEGFGLEDIWVASANGLSIDQPVNINDMWEGTQVNDHEYQGTVEISRDWPAHGSKLYFVSNGNGFWDIFEATWEVETIGDLSGDGLIQGNDIDLLTNAMRSGSLNRAFDLDGSQTLTSNDRLQLIETLAGTWIGDSNLDGEFDSSDFVIAFTAGKYEQEVPALWGEGDWNGDTRFNSADLVYALQRGGYEQGPRQPVVPVPEPSAQCLIAAGCFVLVWLRR